MSGVDREGPTGAADAAGTMGPQPDIRITSGPTPTDEEAAAITAAVQVVLASAGAGQPEAPADAPPRWRFSGRWWSKPVPTRRDRPSLL